MEKILFVINSNKADKSAIEFACYIAKLTRSKLTGIFIENAGAEKVPVFKKLFGVPATETIAVGECGYPAKKNLSEADTDFFEDVCIQNLVRYSIYRAKGHPINEIINESRYADVMVIDETLSGIVADTISGNFVKDILFKSECPVIIAPLSFDGINEIAFAYDGSASSVFAIKHFTYLFPQLSDKKIIILQVNKDAGGNIKQKEKLNELLSPHYSSIGFQTLEGTADEELFKYLFNRKKVFIVMGAFGRSVFSTTVKPSNAELILKTINLPVFIAHR